MIWDNEQPGSHVRTQEYEYAMCIPSLSHAEMQTKKQNGRNNSLSLERMFISSWVVLFCVFSETETHNEERWKMFRFSQLRNIQKKK